MGLFLILQISQPKTNSHQSLLSFPANRHEKTMPLHNFQKALPSFTKNGSVTRIPNQNPKIKWWIIIMFPLYVHIFISFWYFFCLSPHISRPSLLMQFRASDNVPTSWPCLSNSLDAPQGQGTGWGPREKAVAWTETPYISGWILWFMVNITN